MNSEWLWNPRGASCSCSNTPPTAASGFAQKQDQLVAALTRRIMFRDRAACVSPRAGIGIDPKL